MPTASGLKYIQHPAHPATATIEKLLQAFANHGLPEIVVSDNGSGFANEEFTDLMATNVILHVKHLLDILRLMA